MRYRAKESAILTPITASQARADLYRLIDQTAQSHQPILISGKRSSAVLVSAADWQAIQVFQPERTVCVLRMGSHCE